MISSNRVKRKASGTTGNSEKGLGHNKAALSIINILARGVIHDRERREVLLIRVFAPTL